jgi:hypothetical protein
MMAGRWIIWKALAMGAGLGGVTLLIAGVPSDVIANPWFTRMTPVRPQDYVFLGLTALLAAALGATYAFPAVCPFQPGTYGVGTYLSVLAVGCPICNKVVVLLLGISGALTIFQPVQPILAVGGLALLGYALTVRLRVLRAWPGAGARGAARGM